MSSRIPTLDIRRFETDRETFVAELGAAYREWGFAGISGHGIPQAQIDASQQQAQSASLCLLPKGESDEAIRSRVAVQYAVAVEVW